MPIPTASGEDTASILPAVLLAIAAYTLSASAQTYWQLAPLSYYGQLLFFLAAVSTAAFAFLACLAAYLSDASVLLPHSSPAQRRAFCFTCCPSRTPAAAPAAAPLPHPYSALPALRWTHLTQTELLLLLGANNAVASLLQWYSNPPSREPPLVNGLVPTLQALLAVPLARHALGDRRKFLRGGGWLPALAAACIVLGVAVSVVPAATAATAAAPAPAASGGAPPEPSADVLLWTLLNVASQLPSAMALVGAQAYLLRAGAMERGAPPARRAVALTRFVLFNQAGVGLVTGLCWWLDVLPWFGSSSPGSWWSGLRFSFACSLGAGGDACPPRTALYAALTVLPYGFYLAGIAAVSGASAVTSNALEVGQSALQTCVWLVPGVNPAPAATPLWSALLSCALTLGGVALLRLWEARQGDPAVTAEGLLPVGEPEARWYGEAAAAAAGEGVAGEAGQALLAAEGAAEEEEGGPAGGAAARGGLVVQ